MTDSHLANSHSYFDLSDYAIDPHSRYMKRIFHEGGPAPSMDTDEITSISVTKQGRTEERVERDGRRKRRRESTADGYATDGSYAEIPPMSPFSSEASACEGIEDIGDDTDSPNVSDRERVQHPGPDLKGKGSAFPPKLPIAIRLLPKITTVLPNLPNAPAASSSIVQYSTTRLAERARLAGLPVPPVTIQARSPVRPAASHGTIAHAYGFTAKYTAEEKPDEGQPPRIHNKQPQADTSNVIRARRATIGGFARGSQSSSNTQAVRRKPVDEPIPTATADIARVKLERASPLLDWTVPERPHSASHVVDPVKDSVSAAPVAGPSRRRHKRSKSSSAAKKVEDAPSSAGHDKPNRRSNKPTVGVSLTTALETGDYDQIKERSWVCKVHGDSLGGPRSVTRHHESVHLNIGVECEYCNGRFSRRDAMLRHQRQGGCKVIDWSED